MTVFNNPNKMYQVIFHVLCSPGVWLTTLLCTCLCLLPYILIEYINTTVGPTLQFLFGGNHNDVDQKNGETIHTNDDYVSDTAHDINVGIEMSTTDSAAVQREHNVESSKSTKNNDATSFAANDPGHVKTTTEYTHM